MGGGFLWSGVVAPTSLSCSSSVSAKTGFLVHNFLDAKGIFGDECLPFASWLRALGSGFCVDLNLKFLENLESNIIPQ